MKMKRMISIAATIVGVILIGYAIHSMNRISSAKGTVQSIGSAISNSAVGKMVTGEMNKQASQYDAEVMWLLIGGIILVVVGGGGLFFYRKK